MDDSSIVKSGSSDIVGQSRSVSDLLPIDNSTESTAITPEQLQSIRNGLSTTIVLTEQIVQVLSKGNDLLSRDIKKVRNLKRRVRRQIPTTGLLGSKFATDLLKKPVSAAKGAATPLAGALALEAAANLLDDDKIETTTQNFDTSENVIRKVRTMGIGDRFKKWWKRIRRPNRKVTSNKDNKRFLKKDKRTRKINSKKKIKKVDTSKKKIKKKKINSKKLIKDISKLKIPSAYGLVLSLGGSSRITKEL